MKTETTTQKDGTRKTWSLLPVFYLLSLIFYLCAGCENAENTPTVNEANEGDPSKPTVSIPAISIATAEDFAKIGNNAAYPLNGIYTLKEDLSLAQWSPIGTTAKPFTGTLRGNGKTITVESFSAATLQGEYIGVLGYASGAKFENLTLSLGLSSQTTIGMPSQGDQIVGGLVANALHSEFTGIHAEGALNLQKNIARDITAGGIVGVLERSTVRDSVSTIALTLKLNAMSGSGITAGGIVGSADLSAIFTSSYTGTLHCTSIGSLYVGGIAGWLRDHRSSPALYKGDFGIYDCSASGTITTGNGACPYIGGIVGSCDGAASYNPAIISRCASTMNITASASSVTTFSTPYGLAGGITAQLSGYSAIRDSYFRGNIALTANFEDLYAGGIAGNVSATAKISRCYAAGTVSAHTNSAYSPYYAMLPTDIYAGGIGGRIYSYNNGTPLIEHCAALNSGISLAKYSEDGVRPRRIGDTGNGGELSGNIANEGTTITITKHNATTPDPPAMEKTAGGMDGADCAAKPDEAAFTAMGWDFAGVWKMGGDGYPVLDWEEE